MRARIAFILIVLFCQSCSYSDLNIRPVASWTGLIANQATDRRSQWAVDANSRIYIALPSVGYQDDLLMTEMVEVFLRYYPRARPGLYRESLEQAFVSARFAGMHYVVYADVKDFRDQNGVDKVIREDIHVSEFHRGEATMEIYIYASQGEELVDHLTLETKGSVFTFDSRKLIWPPLDAYLRSLSQYELASR